MGRNGAWIGTLDCSHSVRSPSVHDWLLTPCCVSSPCVSLLTDRHPGQPTLKGSVAAARRKRRQEQQQQQAAAVQQQLQDERDQDVKEHQG